MNIIKYHNLLTVIKEYFMCTTTGIKILQQQYVAALKAMNDALPLALVDAERNVAWLKKQLDAAKSDAEKHELDDAAKEVELKKQERLRIENMKNCTMRMLERLTQKQCFVKEPRKNLWHGVFLRITKNGDYVVLNPNTMMTYCINPKFVKIQN